MSVAPPYVIGYSFAGFEAANPSSPKPGAALDVELAAIQRSINGLRAYVGLGASSTIRVISAEGAFPFSVLEADDVIIVTTPLTADRVLQLPTLGLSSDNVDIVRSPVSTGAFDLIVKDHLGGVVTTIAAHADGRYARITWTGAAFLVSTTTGSLPGGVVKTWQLRAALGAAGLLDDVEATAAFDVNPGGALWEAWNSGAAETAYGDALSDAIVLAIGAGATQAAYVAAFAVSL